MEDTRDEAWREEAWARLGGLRMVGERGDAEIRTGRRGVCHDAAGGLAGQRRIAASTRAALHLLHRYICYVDSGSDATVFEGAAAHLAHADRETLVAAKQEELPS